MLPAGLDVRQEILFDPRKKKKRILPPGRTIMPSWFHISSSHCYNVTGDTKERKKRHFVRVD
jgi:hypothetical protein